MSFTVWRTKRGKYRWWCQQCGSTGERRYESEAWDDKDTHMCSETP